jgi:hypothetical protein
VVLVTLICPKAIIGGASAAKAGQSALQKWIANIPAAALQASQKGVCVFWGVGAADRGGTRARINV